MSLRERGLSLNCHLFYSSPLAGRAFSPNGPQTPSVDSRATFSAAAHYLLSPSTLPPCPPSPEERSGQARNCLCSPLSDELGDTPTWSPRALARNCLTAVMIIKTVGSVVARGACSLATASFPPSPASSCPARPFLAQVLSSFPPQCLCTGCSLEWMEFVPTPRIRCPFLG